MLKRRLLWDYVLFIAKVDINTYRLLPPYHWRFQNKADDSTADAIAVDSGNPKQAFSRIRCQ